MNSEMIDDTRIKSEMIDDNLSDVRTGRALLGGEHKTHVATLLCTLHLAALA